LDQFIVINDKVEMDARFFLYQTEDEGKRARYRRDRERVWETERCWKRGI